MSCGCGDGNHRIKTMREAREHGYKVRYALLRECAVEQRRVKMLISAQVRGVGLEGRRQHEKCGGVVVNDAAKVAVFCSCAGHKMDSSNVRAA